MLGACANVQEPRCPGVTEPTVLVHVAGGISPASARAKVHGSHMSQGATLLHPRGGISPAFLYPAGFSNSTQSWQRELEDRKWRANAEHILKIERPVCTVWPLVLRAHAHGVLFRTGVGSQGQAGHSE